MLGKSRLIEIFLRTPPSTSIGWSARLGLEMALFPSYITLPPKCQLRVIFRSLAPSRMPSGDRNLVVRYSAAILVLAIKALLASKLGRGAVGTGQYFPLELPGRFPKLAAHEWPLSANGEVRYAPNTSR